jgi:hypothetical protein
MAELSLLAAVRGDERAGDRARELYALYEPLYFALPNRDNVLGPSHLFFSTYLESLWLTSYLAGAFMLREQGALDEELAEGVSRVAEEAAGLIADFNEGLSNRQTWHAAALTAVAAWFGDEELARTAVESRTGLVGHLADGFGADGVWWEGENYHLFALRGLLTGLHWSRAAGYDILEDDAVREHFRAAVLAPSRSALPDLTYPARRDSRYGVSLAEPPSLELWEAGRSWLPPDPELDGWIRALTAAPAGGSRRLLYDAWLHDAGLDEAALGDRTRLSWWALTFLTPAPPEDTPPWTPGSILLPDQGLAILREGARYASLECGREIGGHGHPDRLHLTLHADGVHWLPDPGTGSYVEALLGWYRSALAHNAPRLGGRNAAAEGWCEAFEQEGKWGWCRGRAGRFTRTLIGGPGHLIDQLELEQEEPGLVDLPWHFQGDITVDSPGRWEAVEWEERFVERAERFIPVGGGPIHIDVNDAAGSRLRVVLHAPGAELLRALAPGLPGSETPRPFLLLRTHAASVRWVTLLEPAPSGSAGRASGLGVSDRGIEVTAAAGTVRYTVSPSALTIEAPDGTQTLSGLRPAPPRRRPLIETRDQPDAHAVAPGLEAPPSLDGSLDGFDLSETLVLDLEHQYRRSEEPYQPERFSARAWINWDGDALWAAVAVAKPELVVPDESAGPLQLDNESDDIHADGVQIHLALPSGPVGVLAMPRGDGALHIRPLGESSAGLLVEGRWTATEEGYQMTLRLEHPDLPLFRGSRLGFDLLVNEMQPDRLRRAGQLVWSGHGGWVYLRGDRQDPAEFGVLELG